MANHKRRLHRTVFSGIPLKAKGYKDWDDCDIDDSGMTLKKDFMYLCASPAHRNVEVNQLLEQVKKVNSVSAADNEPYLKYPVHQELKMPEDTAGRNKIRKAILKY